MQDPNARAPKTRRPEMSQTLGSIIKISSILVVAALIVLITFISIELFKRNKPAEKVFEDRITVTLEDFKMITTPGEYYEDIAHLDVREIMLDKNPEEDVVFFFYYGSKLKDYDKDKKELFDTINNLSEGLPFFIVDLDGDSHLDEAEGNEERFIDYLVTVDELANSNKIDINTTLNNHDSWGDIFALSYNTEKELPYEDFLGNDVFELINELSKIKDED